MKKLVAPVYGWLSTNSSVTSPTGCSVTTISAIVSVFSQPTSNINVATARMRVFIDSPNNVGMKCKKDRVKSQGKNE